MANTLSLTRTAHIPLAGGYYMAIGTFSLAADGSSAYADGGIALPSNWDTVTMGFPAGIVKSAHVTPLTAATIDLCFVAKVDLTNEKLALFGGASTAAEDVPLEELTTANLTTGTYTGTVVMIGY